MWELNNPTIERAVLDFSSSGQQALSVSRLTQDSQIIFNAIELIDWAPSVFQAIVCEACGTPGCASGGWVTLRRSGELVLLIPALEEISEPKRGQLEFAPPGYLLERGAAYWTNSDYDELRILLPRLPDRDGIRQLRSREALALFRLEAPHHMFGVPPGDFTVRDDNLVGTSHGDARSIVNEIKGVTETISSKDQAVTIREARPGEEVISLYIDSFDFVDWGAMVRSETGSYLMLASKFVVDTEAPSN